MKYLPTIAKLTACLCAGGLTMCDDKADSGATNDSAKEKNTGADEKSAEQIAAEKVIAADANLEIVSVDAKKGTVYFQNKHTGLGVDMSFQDVIEGKFERIKGDAAAASKMFKPRKSGKLSDNKAHDPADWGSAPSWIPRIPGMEVQPNKIHSPRDNGTVWGQLTGVFKGDLDTLKNQLIAGFKSHQIEVATDINEETKTTLMFQTKLPKKAPESKSPIIPARSCAVSLEVRDDVVFVSIQYTYTS